MATKRFSEWRKRWLPSLPLAQSPAVTLQLVHDGACWETAHTAPAVRNDGAVFQDQ